MHEQSVIVWDLETVPDLKAAARMFGMAGEPEQDVRKWSALSKVVRVQS